MGAGLLPRARGRVELLVLAGYAAVSSLVFGLLLNLAFWPLALGDGSSLSYDAARGTLGNLQTFLLYDAATSLGWDLGRALTTVALVLLAGPAVLAALRRASRRAAFEAPVEFAPQP